MKMSEKRRLELWRITQDTQTEMIEIHFMELRELLCMAERSARLARSDKVRAGKVGGPARAAKLSAERRSEIGKMGAAAAKKNRLER